MHFQSKYNTTYTTNFVGLNLIENSSTSYRYGFNGMEADDEVKGQGNSYDFGARMYDNRVGRWLSRDALEAKYPNTSTYSFVGNSPIFCIDPDGKKIKPTNDPANFVIKKAYETFNEAGFNIGLKDGVYFENPDSYKVAGGIATGETWSVSSQEAFSKKMKKYNKKYTKQELTDLYSIYLGIQMPAVVEIQITTTMIENKERDFTTDINTTQDVLGSQSAIGKISTVNSENQDLDLILQTVGSITPEVGEAIYNQKPITIETTPATNDSPAVYETKTIVPTKKGADWIYFNDISNSVKGQIFIDGTGKDVKGAQSVIGKALSSIQTK